MDDTAQQLAIRDSFLRKMAAKQSTDELMRDLWQMQQASWDRLLRIPEAFEIYKRQQFKQRAIDVRPEYFDDQHIPATLKDNVVPVACPSSSSAGKASEFS